MFTPEELNNLGLFLSRVDLKGQESIAHAQLMLKIRGLAQQKQDAKPEPERKSKTD